MNLSAIQLKTAKKTAGKRSLFDNGDMAVTLPPQPRFQAVGLAYLSVKFGLDRTLVENVTRTPVLEIGHLSKDTLVSRKGKGGRRGETSGWENKTNPPT